MQNINPQTNVPINKKFIVLIALLIFGFIFANASYYVVKDGTVGVISTFGKFNDNESLSGLHFKIPIIQDVEIKDVKMQTVNYRGDQREDDSAPRDGVTQRPRVTILDSKNLPIGIDISIQFTPEAARMSDILRDYGHNYFDKKINPIIRDAVRDVASGYDAEDISKSRGEIGLAMKSKLTEAFDGLPFLLNDVALRDLVLPQIIREKVIAVQEAKQEEQRLAMVEKQAEVNKKIAIINAEKQAAERVIQAKGEAEAILAKAEAQSEANKKVSASLSSILVQQNWVDKWDGVQPKYMLGEKTNMLMQVK